MIPDEPDHPAVDDVRGLWKRTLYRRGNAAADDSSEVYWLQAAQFFADLRRPIHRVSFKDVACLRDLEPAHLDWLVAQQAFAGSLRLTGTLAWWQRSIDFQPESPFADRAQLQQSGDVIEEYGTEVPYYERWERQSPMTRPCWGLQLRRASDLRTGYLVRAGESLMFARTRAAALPLGHTLLEALHAAPSLQAKQDLLDFEVSLASPLAADSHVWSIDRSTLPFKEGTQCAIRRSAGVAKGAASVEIDDVDANGKRMVSRWEIVTADSGDAATM